MSAMSDYTIAYYEEAHFISSKRSPQGSSDRSKIIPSATESSSKNKRNMPLHSTCSEGTTPFNFKSGIEEPIAGFN